MKDIVIKIDRKTSQVFLNKKVLGISGENLQGNLIFEFIDDFVDGVAWLEIEVGQTKGYLPLTKEDNSYKLPILSSLLANKGNLTMQLRITAKENAEDVPVFKSNIFYLEVKEAINSIEEIKEQYPNWFDEVNKKIDLIKTDGLGNKYLSDDGTYKYVEGGGSGGGTGGVTDYRDLEGKPSINNVELYNNKTLDELGIQAKGDYALVDDIPTKVSELDNDSNYLTSIPAEYVTDTELQSKGYATETYVKNEIANAQLGGGDTEIDLSGYATKDELANKVDKETGKSLIANSEIERLANVTNYDDTAIKNTLNSKASISDMTNYIEEHKEELKGDTGPQGERGIQGEKGDTGATGPQGPKGETGETGPVGPKGDAGNEGPMGPQGPAGNDGAKGDKGDKGDTGEQGPRGEKGQDGYTPVKGTDYYTDDEKEEIENFIITELVEKKQLIPEYVNGIEECIDTNKLYVLPDGYIYAYILAETVASGGYTNLVPTSTDTDGSIYNGTGYKDNARLSSSGGVSGSAQNGSVTTGFIEFKNTDVIRMKGAEWLNATTNYTGHFYLMFYDANKTFISGGLTSSSAYQGEQLEWLNITYDEATGVTKFDAIDSFERKIANAAYFRLNAYGKGENLIVTVNEEIIEETTALDYCWAKFVPAEYINRIIALENKTQKNSDSIQELQEQVNTIPDVSSTTSILTGKKWVVFGDSFTAGGYSSADGFDESEYKFQSGKYTGRSITYPYIIAERNDMEVISYFAGGRTLANPTDGTFTNSITNPSSSAYYQNIPEDADYITIYLGINDSHHESGVSGTDGEDVTGVIPLGTIEDKDTSTFYGAWNVVLPWLMTNRPTAHIGIIVSNGCDRVEYRTATIEIAKKWGIPYLDLNGDERCPAMIRAQNPDLSTSVLNILKEKWRIRDGNSHPNTKAHYFQSTFIENWLRTL